MAWCMAGAMAHLQRVLAESDGVTVMQPTRGCEWARRGETIVSGGLRQAINPKLIAFVGADDGQAQLFSQIGCAAGVVNVGVREPDLLKRHAQLFASGFQQGQIATGIDDGALHGFIAPDDGAVLLEGGNGDGFVLKHVEMLAAFP